MIRITFSPQRRDDTLSIIKNGDAITINGEEFDFGAFPEGAILPVDAIDSQWIVGPVRRINGVLEVTILLPHGPTPSHAVAFPEPIEVTDDGPVELPL